MLTIFHAVGFLFFFYIARVQSLAFNISMIQPGPADPHSQPSNLTILGMLQEEPQGCFPREFFPQEPDSDDCLKAARVFQADPFYRDDIVYSRLDNIGRKVPLYFTSGTCSIFLDSPPEAAPTDRFTLASVWPALSKVIRDCIYMKKPGFRMGGFMPVGNDRGFLIVIGARPHRLTSTTTTRAEATVFSDSTSALALPQTTKDAQSRQPVGNQDLVNKTDVDGNGGMLAGGWQFPGSILANPIDTS